MARRLAATMSQAPGLSGTPDTGHCSSAATSASCAKSSARPISRTSRVRAPMSLGDSIRHTASMVRCKSVVATPPITSLLQRSAQALVTEIGVLPLKLGTCSFAQLPLSLPKFRSKFGTEVLRLEDLANFNLRLAFVRIGTAFDPLDRLFH